MQTAQKRKLFFDGTSLSLLLDTTEIYFDIVFIGHRNKTRSKKLTLYRRVTSLLDICRTLLTEANCFDYLREAASKMGCCLVEYPYLNISDYF